MSASQLVVCVFDPRPQWITVALLGQEHLFISTAPARNKFQATACRQLPSRKQGCRGGENGVPTPFFVSTTSLHQSKKNLHHLRWRCHCAHPYLWWVRIHCHCRFVRWICFLDLKMKGTEFNVEDHFSWSNFKYWRLRIVFFSA